MTASVPVVASISEQDTAECGCTDSVSPLHGIVPEPGVVMESTSPTLVSSPATFTVGGIAPSSVTFNFTHYPGHMEAPVTVVPNTGSRIKIESASETAGCYFNDDGNCAVCGY